jgi:anti-sigma B factor antagonist
VHSPTLSRRPAKVHFERRQVGAVAVFEVHGVLDLFTAPDLRRALQSEAEAGSGPVVVDLGDVSFIDSTGVAVLVRCQRALGRERAFAVSRPPTGAVARLLERIRAEQIFTLRDRPDLAIAAVA